MAFNKGPAYGLSAEVKNKVGGLFFTKRPKWKKLLRVVVSLVEPNHLGLHFVMRVQI